MDVMNVTPQQLVYMGIIKQACYDYVDWKRAKSSRLIEAENFIRSIDFMPQSKINSEWLINRLDEYAAGNKKKYWRIDIAALFNVIGGCVYVGS